MRKLSLLVAAIAGLGPVGFVAVAGPAHADVPAGVPFKSHKPAGAWNHDGYVFSNDMFATAAPGSQTIWAYSYRNWGVESTQPATAGVKAYPYVGRRYASPSKYSKLLFLRSDFTTAVVPAPDLRAAAEYRIWLNNRAVEVTIQINNHGLTPGGSKIGVASYYLADFDVFQTSKDHFVFSVKGPQRVKGRVHLLSALRWLVNHPHGHGQPGNYLSAHTTISEIDFGWAIASTGGTPLDFDVTGYSVSSAIKVPAKGPQPAAAAAGPAQGWALLVGIAAVFVAVFMVTVLLFGRLDRATQGRTLTTMFARYGPRNEPAPEPPQINQGVVATVAVGAMTRVMSTGTHDRLARRLDLAGSVRKPAEWALLGTCLAVGVAATLSLVTSYVFIGVLGGAVIGWLAMRLSLSIRILRRRASFSDQLPDILQLIASTLQAGFSLPQALDAVIRQENQPTAGEFSRALAEARIGADLDVALEAVAVRMGSDDLRWTVMAIRIQQGVGGNLAEVLLTISDTIRERAYLRRQVSALSAEGRLSAYILVALPVLVATWLFVSSGDYMRPLYTTPMGEALLAIASVLLIIGTFWMRRTIKIEV